MFLLVLLIWCVSLASVASAQPCLNCDGGQAALTGTVSAGKIKHPGTGMMIDCLVLKLDKPLCMQCEFIGEKMMIQEVQIYVTDAEIKLPRSGRHTFKGEFVPGMTAWYCREVGLMVSRVESAGKAAVPTGPDKEAAPSYVRGNGPLGYGTPDKVIADIARWTHPTKKVLASFGLTVTRLELYRSATYPVFFVREAPANTPLRTLQSQQTKTADNQARAILQANGNWAYEIVTPEGDRLRYNATRAARHEGFDLFREKE